MLQLAADSALDLPGITVLKASAGSGKTYTLTARYVQFLLSPKVPHNDLSNILAITFANNASREMRQEVLTWLKALHARDPRRLDDMAVVLTGGAERAAKAAAALIDTLLARWSDFQVRTIDSFMSMVFRASALEFGFGPELEIALERDPLLDYAFALFLRNAREGDERSSLLDRALRSLLALRAGDGSFPWDPGTALREALREVDARLAGVSGRPVIEELDATLASLGAAARAALERTETRAAASGLARSGRSTFPRLLASAQAGRFADLLGAGTTPPVNKPGKGQDPAAYDSVCEAWEAARAAIDAYGSCLARAWYSPALRIHEAFEKTIGDVKRARGIVFIDDIGRLLSSSLSLAVVPDVYFRLGEKIWHFLVDEFQDTSPPQWQTLFPLVENSLASGGSLFVVGDTKQAIYGFRQADYRIMRSLETENPFASAKHSVEHLTKNFRSLRRVIDLAAEVFRAATDKGGLYAEAAQRSGLDDWTQEPADTGGPGYAEVRVLERDDESLPERGALLATIDELRARGYAWRDIAILAARNDEIVGAASWLNGHGIPVLSFSSLDVRHRGVAEELLALLAFLDSPPDDLAFATFTLGSIFAAAVRVQGGPDPEALRALYFGARSERPLYKAFQEAFPGPWKTFFAGLFTLAGDLPLYDLVSEACVRFSVFERARGEEAALAKLLEVVKDFEAEGGGSLRDFLSRADAESGAWDIEVPRGVDSVRAMTVHKAKGLGFPVVIVLLYGGKGHSSNAGLLEGDDGVMRLVRVTDDLAKRDPALAALRAEDELARAVDGMNALYVALTRARRETYVIGAQNGDEPFPFSLLPASGFEPRPDKGTAAPSTAEGEKEATLSHDARAVAPGFSKGGRLNQEERRRGDLAHRMLELLGAAPSDIPTTLARAARQAAAEARVEAPEAEALVEPLDRLLQDPGLAPLFRPGEDRVVRTEQEYCDSYGHLARMDRVVVDPGAVTVVDWKTGVEEPVEHEQQVRGYMEILAAVYPGRSVTGIIGYIDQGTTRTVA